MTKVGSLGRFLGAAGVAGLLAVTASAGAAGAQGATGRTHLHVYSTPRAAGRLATALLDPFLFNSAQQKTAFARTRAAGATYVRLILSWREIAPATPPAGFVPTDPNSPGYVWAGPDVTVAAAHSAGLTPILDITDPPSWAYAKPPSGGRGGTPRDKDLGAFATAIAKHYDGKTKGVPAEHVFQIWNEPNLSRNLNPVSASAYRGMVNAAAKSIHKVSRKNLVVAGALMPVRQKKVKSHLLYSVAPLAFMRSLLCLSKGKHPHSTCRSKIHFDVWSHHPYTHGGPFGHASNPDDIELGDMPKMHALLTAAVKHHHIVSAHGHGVQFWVTEFGWDTNPPRKNAASLSLAARWTSESLYQMWRSGVSLVTWFLLQDQPAPSAWETGFYFNSPSLADARSKPGLTAFRFPFVAYLKGRKISIWGRDATSRSQVVRIQIRHGGHGRWRRAASIRADRYGIFRATIKMKASKRDWLRATAGSKTSLGFSLRRPKTPHIGPWGY